MDQSKDISLTYISTISAGPNKEEITKIPTKVSELCTERFNEEMDLEDNWVFVKDDSDMMDEVPDRISMTEESEGIPRPSTEGVGEKMDLQDTYRPAENIREVANNRVIMKEKTEYIFEVSTGEVYETMDFEGNLVVDEDDTAEDSEIMDEAAENISVTENVVATVLAHTERACEKMELGAEPVPSLEVSENIRVDENSGARIEIMIENINSKAMFLPSSKREYKVEDKAAENISVTDSVNENAGLGATSLFKTKKLIEMLGQTRETFKAYPLLNTEIADKSTLPNERSVNFALDRGANRMRLRMRLNETEDETESKKSEILKTETKMLNNVLDLKRGKRKRKAPPISKMVMDSIKSLKRNNGASFEEIKKHMEENYPINVKAVLKYHVNNFLKKYVDIEVLEKIGGTEAEERFKIKKWNQ